MLADEHGRGDLELGRFWDDFLSVPPIRRIPSVDSSLGATVRRLHALDATPTPAAGLAEQVWEELMGSVSAHDVSPIVLVPKASLPREDYRAPTPAGPLGPPTAGQRRWRSMIDLGAIAALLLITVGGAIFMGRFLNGSGTDEPASLGFVGTPVVGPDVPAPEECRVTPRPIADVLGFAATAAANGVVVDARAATPAPLTGQPADTSTTNTVVATIREWLACRHADDPLRLLALYTDDNLRRVRVFPGAADPLGALVVDLIATPVPVPAKDRVELVAVTAVRLLDGGRVLADVTFRPVTAPTSDGPAPPSTVIVSLANENGRYLIDEIFEPASLAGVGFPSPTPTPPGLTATIQAVSANLRARATTDSMIVDELDGGTILLVTGPVEEGGGISWVPVTVQATGATGYVSEQVIRYIETMDTPTP